MCVAIRSCLQFQVEQQYSLNRETRNSFVYVARSFRNAGHWICQTARLDYPLRFSHWQKCLSALLHSLETTTTTIHHTSTLANAASAPSLKVCTKGKVNEASECRSSNAFKVSARATGKNSQNPQAQPFSTILENRKKLDWIDPLPSCHGLHAPLKVNANERASAIMFTLAPLHGASIGGARIHAHQLRADPPPYHPIATHRLLLGTHKQVVARTSSGTGSSGS